MKSTIAIVALATAAMCGCQSSNTAATGPTHDEAMTKNMLTGNSSLNMQDKTFVTEAASGGMFEVQSSQLALQKSSDANIRSFAQHMIDDHTKANDKLKMIAQSKGLTVPTTLNQKHQNVLDRLNSTNGSDFDVAYMRAQVDAHRETITLFRDESRMGSDADLKNFADATLPTLQKHLAMATAGGKPGMHDGM